MADAKIKLLLDMEDNVSGGLKAVNKNVYNFQQNVQDMQPVFKSMAAIGTASFAAITGAATYSISAYQDAERAQRQLEHAVIGVSKGTKEQAQAISDMTDALQKKSGIDGDALKMGAAQLSTFGLQTQSVVDLTKSLADLTVNQNGVNASSDQYVQSANVLAKALNGQFGVLEKSGIRFTEAQQNMILYGTEAEKVSALQEGLAQNLRETTDTLDGIDAATARANRSFGEIAESIGAALEPILLSLAETITPVIQAISDWVAANPVLVQQIVLIGGGIAAVVAAVGLLGMALPAIITGFSALGAVLGVLISPVGLVVAAIVGLASYLIYLYNTNEEARNKINEAWTAISEFIGQAISTAITWFNQLSVWLTQLWTDSQGFRDNVVIVWQAVSDFIGQAVTIIMDWFGQFTAWLNELYINNQDIINQIGVIWNGFVQFMTQYFQLVWNVITWFVGGLTNFLAKNEYVKAALLAIWEIFKAGFTAVLTFLGDQIRLFLTVVEMIVENANKVIGLAKEAWEKFKTWWTEFWGNIGNTIKTTIDNIKGWIDDMIKKITGAISAIGDFLAQAAKVGSFGLINISSGPKSPRASGGPVNPNTSYLVGERRPEVFIPSGYGRIAAAGAGGGGVTLNISGNSFYGPDDLSDMVMESLVGRLKNNIMIS